MPGRNRLRNPRVLVVVAAISGLLSACGVEAIGGPTSGIPGVEPAVMTDAGEVCVDFYRSSQESIEEEFVYMRVFADRIASLGRDEAAVVLADLADQWEVGVWDGEHDEVWQSGLWANAGASLAATGATRCADLAEWWGIDGYEGEPDPKEVLDRQAAIWLGNAVSDYYLLIAQGDPRDRFTQINVRVREGLAEIVTVVEDGSVEVDDLPTTVNEVYQILLDHPADVWNYDLVYAVPRLTELSDGSLLHVKIHAGEYPSPIGYFGDLPEDLEEKG